MVRSQLKFGRFRIERQLWNGDEQSAGLQPPAACLSKGRKLRVPGPGHFRVPLAALLFRDMPVWPQVGPESSVSTSVRESPYAVPRGHHPRISVVFKHKSEQVGETKALTFPDASPGTTLRCFEQEACAVY